MDRETTINDFLQRFAEDWAQGSARSLDEYRALFPGREVLIEEQFALIHGVASVPDESSVRSTSSRAAASGDGSPLPLDAKLAAGFALGPYRLLRELGHGGQGEVWLAEDQRIERKVALKTLTALGRLSAQDVERLRREARVASRLDHPGICTVYEADQVEGVPFVAMQWIDGPSLRSAIRLAREGEPAGGLPLPARRREDVLAIAAFFEAAARALHHAHAKGVLHRDVKPGNILVDAAAHPVLLDFGLARDLEGDEATASEGISGTPAYLAPERLAIAAPPTDVRVDVYGLGVSLYEALTLERPFAAPTREQLFRSILEIEPPDPRRANAAIPRDLSVVIATAMAKEPDRRYESAAAFAADLAAVRERRGIAARPPSVPQRIRLWAGRHPRLAWLSGLLALAAVAIAALGGYLAARWPDIRTGREAAAEEARRARMELGFAELGDLDRGGAKGAFESALATAPDDVLARAGLALAHLAEDEPAEALAVLDAHPRSDEATDAPLEFEHVRAEALRWAGEWERAAALDASLPPPASSREHFVRGALELFRGHEGRTTSFAPAVEHLVKVLLMSKRGFAFEHVALADALTHAPTGDWPMQVAEAMRRGWPQHPGVQIQAGIALEKLDPAAARSALELACELETEGTLAALVLADHVLFSEGPEAAAEYTDGLDAHCANDAERAMLARIEGRIAMRSGRSEEALEHLRRAVHLNPRRELHAVELLQLVAETGGPEPLEAEARDLLRAHPGVVRARIVLAERMLERGEIADVSALLDDVHARTPWSANAHFLSGLVRASEGSALRAVHHFERSAECQPSARTTYELLRARLDAGDLNGLAAAARALDQKVIERAERLARVAEETERFLAENIPRFSASLPATATQLEAAARAFELSGEFGEAERAWGSFARASEAPATAAGTAWWRSSRAGLVAAGEDEAHAERVLGVIASELAAAERAWRGGRATARRIGEVLHVLEVEPALERWRARTDEGAWSALFADVRRLRAALAASTAAR